MEARTRFEVKVEGKIPVVQVIGDLDHYNTPAFRDIVANLSARGHKHVVVDMSGITFMDSGGMSGLVFALKHLAKAGGKLFLVNCTERIMRKLDISGFTKMPDRILVCTSLEQAIEDIEKAQDS